MSINTFISKKKKENKEGKKEKKINPEKYKRLLRMERRADLKHLIFFLIITIIIAAIVVGYGIVKPIYDETATAMYEALTTMNENSFLRIGNTEIYDKDDKLIGRIGNEKYEYVDISDISPYITQAYIAKEDRNFATHLGVDFKATLRAGLSLIKNRGEITQGGSTITQQVVKNNLLTQQQTFKRKFTEIFIAFGVEKEYNKAQIMEFYCNSNYYGNGCYGVEGASQYYFGCFAKDVTLAQAAILVATSNSPNNYNPVVDYDLCMEQKASVLDDMLECEFITEDECKQAKEDQPEIVQKSDNIKNESYQITYAVHSAALKYMEINGFEFKYTFETDEEYKTYNELYSSEYNKAVEEIRTGGYKIYTSLDNKIQKQLQKKIDKELKGYKEKDENGIYTLQSAAVCIDNESDMVVAIVGGREGMGSFNRGYQAKRQPGSSIKPLLDYGPAFNEGYLTPASILEDKQLDINGYRPKNAWSGYVGNIDVRTALVKSYNTIAIQAFMMTGAEKSLSYLDKLHFSSITYSDMISLPISVGGFTYGVTVDNIAKGYSTIANGGQYTNNTCVRELLTYNNESIYKATEEKEEVYNADTAFMLTDVLEGQFKESYGAGYKYIDSKQNYAGKTGTTNDFKDVWFCGFSPYYTTAVWIGYDMPKPMEGITANTTPCKIWTEFMDDLHKNLNLEPKEFEVPYTIRLEAQDGTRREVSYSENVYKSRPKGWDYVSTILEERRKEAEAEVTEKRLQEMAEAKVADFENFNITKVEEAIKVTELYQEAYNLASQVNNSKIRAELLERIASKYEILNKDVITIWNDAIEAYNKSLQEKREQESELQAQLSIEAAREARKTAKLELVQYYIDNLNERTVYTTIIEEMIENAKLALEDCVEYPEDYQRLAIDLNLAINRVLLLPVSDYDGDAPSYDPNGTFEIGDNPNNPSQEPPSTQPSTQPETPSNSGGGWNQGGEPQTPSEQPSDNTFDIG